MINWVSADIPPKKYGIREYLVTVEYSGEGNVNGRTTMVMTYEEKGRGKVPTWCRKGIASIWKVLFWAELPDSCQD